MVHRTCAKPSGRKTPAGKAYTNLKYRNGTRAEGRHWGHEARPAKSRYHRARGGQRAPPKGATTPALQCQSPSRPQRARERTKGCTLRTSPKVVDRGQSVKKRRARRAYRTGKAGARTQRRAARAHGATEIETRSLAPKKYARKTVKAATPHKAV
ncbi:hypothetical protein B0H16DRAFT_1588314, partial [Mycena metata]